MDSKYAFTTIHVQGALYKERGLINSGEKIAKYGQEILKLLKAVQQVNSSYTLMRAPEWGDNSCSGKLKS
jgi:hypothetical protein